MKTRERTVVALSLAVGLGVPTGSRAETLPVFKLAEARVDPALAKGLLAGLNRGQFPPEAKPVERPGVVGYRAGKRVVEIEKASGGVFLADFDRLWNPMARPKAPGQAEAQQLADRFLAEQHLLPAGDKRVRLRPATYSESAVAADVPGPVQKTVLDVQVNYGVEVTVKREGREQAVPVVGGGGEFKVALGEGGAVVGYAGVWRPIATVEATPEIVSQAAAEAAFKKRAGSLKLTRVQSFLAYYSAPAFERQTHLAPVWVVQAEAEIDGQRVPLRNEIVAATKFGPAFRPVPAKPRKGDEKPLPPSLEGDEGPTTGDGGSPSPLGRVSRLFELPVARAQNPFEAGTSWIGPSQGLGGSPANAQGFVNGLAAAGWTVNFNWGEAAAFESDWNANDDSWVDAADFVFYTGHANSDGWVLNKPDDTFLRFSEVGASPGSPNDRYGQNDLEWIVIAACGPHQSSHFTTGVGNAFDRWRGIFDGLHVFMGYGAITYDNTTEGSRVVELARAGWPVIDAWFRTAWEIQPSTNGASAPNGPNILVTAMYAHMGDHATRNDHIWGAGTTVADPVGPGQQRFLMWSGT